MRILHFSDVHVGVENYGRPATEADLEALPDSFAPGVDRRLYLGLSTRLLDFLAAFDELVAFAVRENVDFVMFSGDAYKSRDPSQTHQREFARRVSSLASQGIPVFLLVGNHDLPHARSSATSLEIFPTLIVPHVTVAEQLETHLIQTRSGPLQVVALPWPRWRNLLSRDQHRGKSVAELKAHVEAEITRRLLREVERLDPAVPAVLSAHVSVLGATYGSERSMALGRDHVLQYGNVALPALDYVGLGHIHKHQVLGDWPPVVYSGSLQAVDFGEENEDKGFCLVEIDPTMPNGRRARWEFVPVPSRTFVTIDVDVSPTAEEPTNVVLREIERTHVAGAIVRLRVRIPAELAPRLDDRRIREALKPAHVVAAFAKEVVRERRPRLGSAASGLPPEEALAWYLGNRQNLDPETRRRALEKGEALIQEELGRE